MPYYLRIPDHLIPLALYDRPVRSGHVSITFEDNQGCKFPIRTRNNPGVVMYNTNQSLEEMLRNTNTLMDECKQLRASIASIADHVGLAAEVPSEDNFTSWHELSKVVHERVCRVICTGSLKGGASAKGN